MAWLAVGRPTLLATLASALIFHIYETIKRPVKARLALAGTGRWTLDERCRLILQRGIGVSETEDFFTVTLPLKSGY